VYRKTGMAAGVYIAECAGGRAALHGDFSPRRGRTPLDPVPTPNRFGYKGDAIGDRPDEFGIIRDKSGHIDTVSLGRPWCATPSKDVAMPPRPKRARPALPPRSAEVLDVHGAAALLMVSLDTVYDLFGRGELPGRKVGRKWITTRSAVLRWIENTATDDALACALERGDGEALAKAMNNGKVKLRAKE
jgi:excisionase family DNA binding protein